MGWKNGLLCLYRGALVFYAGVLPIFATPTKLASQLIWSMRAFSVVVCCQIGTSGRF